MRTTGAALAALIITLSAAGCGGRSALGGGADGGGPVADLAPVLDGALSPDGPTGPDLLPPRVQGLIYQTELRTPQGAQQGAAYVFFTPSPMPFFKVAKALGSGCNLYPDEEVGDVQFSAGKVSFSGGPYSFSLSPDKPLKKNSWLYPGILFDELFDAKTSLTMVADGDELPAFQGTVPGVDDLKVTFPPGNFLARGKAFTLAFPKTNSTVWVTLQGALSGQPIGNIRCIFNGASGKATVTGAALQALPTQATRVTVGAGPARQRVLRPDARLTVHLLATNLVRKGYYLK